MSKPLQSETNGLAIASLILGSLSLTGFSLLAAIPAIITGAMGLKNPNGRNMAIAGLVMGIVSIVFTVMIIALIVILVVAGILVGPNFEVPMDGGLPAPEALPFQQKA